MVTYFLYDNNLILTGSVELEDGSLPPDNATPNVPPEVDPGTLVKWNHGYWLVSVPEVVVPPTPKPELVVLELTCVPPALMIDNEAREVTCLEGCRVTAHCALRVGSYTLPVTDSFRMPIQSEDGRKELVFAQMVNGEVAATFNARSSGAWHVTQAGINAKMAAGHEMLFAGVTVYVVQA